MIDVELLLSSNEELQEAQNNTRKVSYGAHRITTQEESFSSFNSDDLSIEECLRQNTQKQLPPAGLLLDNSSTDSIDRVIDDYYFQQEENSAQVIKSSAKRSSSTNHF